MDWGYSISAPRAVNLDRNDLHYSHQLLRAHPVLQTCIACGNCAATCTAGQFTTMNFRRINVLARRGEYEGLRKELDRCMLCGKCKMGCPRGINIREIILTLKKHLPNY